MGTERQDREDVGRPYSDLSRAVGEPGLGQVTLCWKRASEAQRSQSERVAQRGLGSSAGCCMLTRLLLATVEGETELW